MKRLLLAPLLLTLLVGCSSKDKTLIERRDAFDGGSSNQTQADRTEENNNGGIFVENEEEE